MICPSPFFAYAKITLDIDKALYQIGDIKVSKDLKGNPVKIRSGPAAVIPPSL